MTTLGIDLGTTFSAVAVYKDGEAKIIENQEGSRTTPSVVMYKDDEVLVGEPARRQQITSPESTVYSSKRFIGMKRDQVGEEAGRVSFGVEASESGKAIFRMGENKVTPEEVGAKILQKLKTSAEASLGEKITQAVITVPAYFDNAQRQATKDAGAIAGLEVLRVINEPTAAALAYGLGKDKEQRVIVIDCGGGTTDISLLDVGGDTVEVVGTSGDTHLGGEDFDTRLVDFFADEFKALEGVDLRADMAALQRLKNEAEKVKKELSLSPKVDVNIPFISANKAGPLHLQTSITRSKFEDLTSDLVDRIFECARAVLKDAKTKAEDVDEVVFVGGSTRIPIIGTRSESMFGREPNRSVNPDEIVAMGAAIQGSILAGDKHDILLLDVTSLSLGIETLGQVMTTLIPRNTTIPTRKAQIFSTAADNQTSVTVRVAQGERPMFTDNQELATFNLDDIPAAMRGTPQIEVAFDIDANGIVNVSAKDMATGKDKNVTIKSGLSSEEIDTMVREAEEHAETDQKRVEEVEKMNNLDGLVLNTSKTLRDNKDDLAAKIDVDALEEALTEARRVLAEQDLEAVDATVTMLTDLAHKMAEVMYSEAQAKAAAEAASTDPTSGAEETEEVVDAVEDEGV
jgi:molecular chaperone DnaK